MEKIIFLLEEESMKIFLENFFPRFFPKLSVQYIFFQGKSDLKKRVQNYIKNWKEDGAKFLILLDSDGVDDCKKLKNDMINLCKNNSRLCKNNSRTNNFLVRIVCQELESWYLGDVGLLKLRYRTKPNKKIDQKQNKYRNPDNFQKPSQHLDQILVGFSKRAGARELGAVLDPATNTSKSFQVFVDGVKKLSGLTRQSPT